MKSFLKIVFRLTLGSVLMLAVWFFLFNVASRLVTDMFTSITDDITAKHKSRQEVFANQAAQEKQANEVAAQQVINGAALSRQQQQAFNAQYQAPDGCEVYQSDRHMAECINHKMRAKRAFERSFEQTPFTDC